jgi:PAS domain S-box-containing protein
MGIIRRHDDRGTRVPAGQAEEKAVLREGERKERLRGLLEAAGLGHWDYDYIRDTLVWSEQTRKLLGVESGEPASRALLRSRMHVEDRPRFEEYVARRAYLDADHICNFEFRVVMPNGAIRWLEDQSRVESNSAGMPVRAAGIVRDISERKQAEQALHASKERLQFALDAARLGWGQYDPIHGISWWDTRLKEMFEVAEDKTDIEEFTKRVHPDDAERVWAAMEAALDPTDPKPYATEFRHLRADGEVRWVEAHGLTHFEGAPPERRAVMMVGTAQDITERKRREEERRESEQREHLLMREANHRAKNILSLVQAIARQTAAREPEDFVERFTERIQALAANQDLLVRNKWQGVDVGDLVRAQLAHFADLVGPRIVVHGPNLRLNAAAAQATGLALHELATNAGKYGALSTDSGRVNVSWGTDGDTFTMSWSEREGPPVLAPKRRGFGTMVIEGMAKQSVDGAVELDYAPSGLSWRLNCPAANALEPANFQVEGGPN